MCDPNNKDGKYVVVVTLLNADISFADNTAGGVALGNWWPNVRGRLGARTVVFSEHGLHVSVRLQFQQRFYQVLVYVE